jgi:hypothetical protein
MRALVRLALAAGLLATVAVGAASPPIPPAALLDHIKFLSSDELEGRGNGSAGLERAADYIAQQFRAAGLRPGGIDGGWFQPFGITTGLNADEGNALVLYAGPRAVRLELGESYYPLAVTPNTTPTDDSADLQRVPLVFAGYGLSAPAARYDDYAGVDVSGKAVLILSHEPQENRRDSLLNGARPMPETTLYAKALAARQRGARALIVVSDPVHDVDQANYQMFKVESDAEDHQIPVLRIRRTEAAPLLVAWGIDVSAAAIDRDLVPRSRQLTGAYVDYAQRLTLKRRTVRNVVGVLDAPGTANQGQAIVIGGHYDHVGLGGRFSAAPDLTGQIHNGADDNASGIAALIEIARSASADRSRFARSLVFVAFAGEERGLLGSIQYTMAPAVPLENTVAMLNLDMIGRANGKVEVGGLRETPSLAADLEAAARVAGISATAGGPGAGRSDDSTFLDHHVPALHFFTGFHDDYHRPSDDWNRVDEAGTARVATLALELAARIAARPDRPQLSGR